MNTSHHNAAGTPSLRDLPSVDRLLHQPPIANLLDDTSRAEVVAAVRAVLDQRRDALRAGTPTDISLPALALDVREYLYERARPSLRRVINATGIVLHTGLGRAPLAEVAIEAINDIAAGYCNLELDLDSGERGNRHDHLRDILREVCGAEDALVVNNNAAATYLVLNTFATERQAVISRGQLVEIGGSYRLPDIMAAARCRMIEVGTTNRTRIGDYERAISDQTALLLRVHPSNYRVCGFTESASLESLVELARRHNLIVVDDLGSGLIRHDLPWPAADESEEDTFATDPDTWDEPTVVDSMSTGADLALFSGDKLLGGPQAGIIVGRAELIAALRKNPLARAFRPGKLTLAALEATVRIYRDPAAAVEQLPVFRLLSRTHGELQRAAEALAESLQTALPDCDIEIEEADSEAGGGSLATMPFPTWTVTVTTPTAAAQEVATGLRQRDLPIICRIQDDALVFDLRTLSNDDVEQIPAALAEIINELSETP